MVGIQRAIDKCLGIVIVVILSLFRFLDKQSTRRKNFLVIKLWAIGDSVISLSLVRAIRASYKNVEIDVLTRKRVMPVFESYNQIDHVFDIDNDKLKLIKKIRYYDVVFDCEPYLNLSAILGFFLGNCRIGFSGQTRSVLYNKTINFNKNQHMVQNYLDMLRALGPKFNVNKLEKLSIPAELRHEVDDFLKRFHTKKILVGITPGVAESSKSRQWFAERFAEVADKLILYFDADVMFIDSHDNEKVVDKIIHFMEERPINMVGRFDLTQTIYLISKCNMYISNDTGPMHIAAAQGCKTIGLFGPNTPTLWGPYGKNNVALYKTKLAPSIQNDRGIFPNKNREEYMGPITVDDVMKAVEKLVAK